MPSKGAPRIRRQPQRTCLGCREVEGKRALLRIVRTPNGSVELDPTGKKSGRGAYVHDAKKCIDAVLSSGLLSRSLAVPLGAEIQQQLRSRVAEAAASAAE